MLTHHGSSRTKAVSAQSDALLEVKSGTSDAAIIDLLMADAMIGEGTSYPNLTHTDELTSELYGIGCRKDSNLTDYINAVLAETYADGTMKNIATTYGVQESIVEQKADAFRMVVKGYSYLEVARTVFNSTVKDTDSDSRKKIDQNRIACIVDRVRRKLISVCGAQACELGVLSKSRLRSHLM